MESSDVRIGYLITKFPPITGGGETHTELLARQMSRRSHTVEVMTGFREDRQSDAFPFPVHQVKHLSDKSIDFAAVASIAAILGSANYDVLHIMNYEALLYFCLAEPPSGSRTRIIFSTHNTPLPGHRVFDGIGLYNIEKRDVQRALKEVNVDRFIANSEAFLDGFEDIGIPRERTDLIPFGIDLKLFVPLRDKPANEPGKQTVDILCTSRFVQRKGIEYLLAALDYLPSKYHLHLTGSGSIHDQAVHHRLTQLAARYRERVTLANEPVTIESLIGLYQSADIFVMPSRFEGFGLTALEAMACGTPVVATDVQGLREFVRHRETGLLVEYGNPRQLAHAVERLATDIRLRRHVVRQALKLARDRYDVGRMVDDYESAYRSVIKAEIRAAA